jgi:ketosteroid isomerase-like protein
MLALYDPDCEVIPDRGWPEPGPIRGTEAAWVFYVGVADMFESFGSGDAEVVEGGPDTVIVHRAARVRGRSSGASVEFVYSAVTTLREGKILREEWFVDRAEALAAAKPPKGGIPDGSSHPD